jgi:shikimate kinase
MMKKPVKRIILIGYRGTGKTTVARLLAARLGWDWIDADEYLEQQSGLTIRAIFEKEGEAGFRDREERVLTELCRRENLILATGGGAILRAANRVRLREAGLVVWLTADPETIWARLQADTTTADRRPALTALGGVAEIRHLLSVREPLYRECGELAVDTAGRGPEQIATIILQRVEGEVISLTKGGSDDM